MLEKLLKEVKAGSTSSIEDLALKLNTTPAMIRAMLAHLESANLIKKYQPCEGSCSGCSIKTQCNLDQKLRSTRLYVYEENRKD